MAHKIAFIQKGTVPLASVHVARVLQANFPQYEVEIIDIKELLAHRKEMALINMAYTVKEYGPEILAGKKNAKEGYFRTPYLFHQIKRLMTDKLADSDYVFSFQMQSLYDASADRLPHFVYTDHTNLANLRYPFQDRSRLFSQPWLQLERTIYQNATHIFTRSRHVTNSIVEQYGCHPDKVTCVFAGSNLQADANPLENDGYSNKNILFVGVDWERKGGPELVRAFQQVLQVHPDARLTIVGCTPQVDVPHCEVVGRLPLAQVKEYYRRASVFCLPTKLEPFGIVFIEAFSYKLPVVAARVGAIPDFVIPGVNGYLIEPSDVNHLAQRLIELLADPVKCQAFGEQGFHLVQENYNWEAVGQRMKEQILATLPVKSQFFA
ncbi:MAG: glycosyltransferase family 4 protein [Chloroflexi bacterium]|nr:glycosyltransferase family 4 protein [Ardenticatenaceae bacterium]NOG35819.1 glycosyltransferase family 4 protein [Chloroflexota bacterium]